MRNLRISGFILLITIMASSCQNSKTKLLEKQVAQLTDQLSHTQTSNASLLDRMADLSVINQSDAQSIKQSLEVLNRQNEYIQNLSEQIEQKDSINFALVSNLKRSLININDDDIQVEVQGSAVYISIADKLLFSSGSTKVSEKAKIILGKVAMVINDHKDIEVVVEGHTDIMPIATDKIKDNWDLSVLRATSIVRILQNDYYVDPTRISAAGKSSYQPKMNGDDAVAMAANRRTEIILTPKLSQFFELLESPVLKG